MTAIRLPERLSGAILARKSDLSPAGSAALDAMRALAAFSVMAGHIRGLFFVDYTSVTEKGPLTAAGYFATSLGHEAVIVFFVLSGYFVGANVLGALAGGYWTWRWYLTRRLTRLWIVLLPALCLGAALDHLGLLAFGSGGPYGAEGYAHVIPEPVTERLGLAAFAGNVAFTQEILVKPFGSNGPLWSLSYEFAYYLLFPLLIIGLVSTAAAPAKVAALVLAGVLGAFVGAHILLYFLFWLMGVAALIAPPPRSLRSRWRILAIAAIIFGLVAALTATKSHALGIIAGDALVASACAGLVYLLATTPGQTGAVARVAKAAAGFSYTLYLVHLPLLILLAAMIIGDASERWQPGLATMAAGISLAAAMLAWAYAISLLTEARTDAVRRAVDALWGRLTALGRPTTSPRDTRR